MDLSPDERSARLAIIAIEPTDGELEEIPRITPQPSLQLRDSRLSRSNCDIKPTTSAASFAYECLGPLVARGLAG
ncbi:MAG: hypothetical protein ACRDRQ_23375 [Pseudonocardiaceae bacterium]